MLVTSFNMVLSLGTIVPSRAWMIPDNWGKYLFPEFKNVKVFKIHVAPICEFPVGDIICSNWGFCFNIQDVSSSILRCVEGVIVNPNLLNTFDSTAFMLTNNSPSIDFENGMICGGIGAWFDGTESPFSSTSYIQLSNTTSALPTSINFQVSVFYENIE